MGLQTLIITELAEQKKQLFLWSPIVLAIGIGLYFSLSFEPPLFFGLCAAALGLSLTAFLKGKWRILCLLMSLFAVGFLSGQIRTHMIHTPILQKEINVTMVEGTIEAVEHMGQGAGTRLTLGDLTIEKLVPEQTPVKIRLHLRKDPGLLVGQRIEALAHLNVPSSPVIPGGFDFQRYLYFQQIGAVGFIYNKLKILDDSAVSGITLATEKLRAGIARRIEAAMDYPQAGVAMALTIGRKTAIASDDAEAMRAAGLAHMLAISGLHVGLFSGALFFFARLMMSLIPGFALRHPIKKYAAVIGILSAFVYMSLAGATVPTQRALLMTSIVFLAIIFDRSPISLRLVAFAAFVVLLFFPESLLSASFHMSFAAVTALIVFYEAIRPHWSKWHAQAGIMRRVALYVVGVCLTTVIASLATAPFALFHFQQMANYSLLANVLAMPVMAFIVMPSVVASLLLMPLGLDMLGFYGLDFGVQLILKVAHFVADLPHAVMLTSVWPQAALLCLVGAALIVILFRTRLRLIFIVPITVSLFIIILNKQPDILISSSYKLIAFRGEDHQLYVSDGRSEGFSRENWERAYGHQAGSAEKWPREDGQRGGQRVICDEQACRFTLKGYRLSVVENVSAVAAECAASDIVLSVRPLSDGGVNGDAKSCAALYAIDFFDTYYHGAHALWLDPKGPSGQTIIKASEDLRGNRPWSKLNGEF